MIYGFEFEPPPDFDNFILCTPNAILLVVGEEEAIFW